ncbi:MAG TPA: NUDIX domain-containing protein [Sandaracinaceae bacterium LLY-WYZ-13_1]|nr:NUDIX domain-containing protein [Sandaracinaceae bacterium LLY-WYZ-13_1]
MIASVALVVHRERALVLRRRPNDRGFPHRWCLPGGRIEEGESPRETALRETAEETGLVIELRRVLGPRRLVYAHRPVTFEIHRFTARAARDDVRISDEHVDSRWLSRAEAAEAHRLPSGLAGEVTEELLARFARGELALR